MSKRSDFIFASGGLRDGLDIAKCVPLDASLGGMAGGFLCSQREQKISMV